MSYKAPDISTLSAHEYNKIRQSFDAYNQLRSDDGYTGAPRHNPNINREIAARRAYVDRQPFKRGSYGIEDEYRYMVSQGFKPAPSAAAAPAPAPAPTPRRNTGPVNPPGRLPVRQQPAFDPMMMMMPMLLEAMKPRPVPQAPEPTTYASAGQAAQSAPGVKIRRSDANKSRQNTKGTRGSFNRNDLRISNLNL